MDDYGDDLRRLTDLLIDNPSLSRDLMRWARSAQAVGQDGAFIAYRDRQDRDHTCHEASEPRLLRSCGDLGMDCRLYQGDNLAVLHRLNAEGVSARCVYIDPPYGTQQQFGRRITEHPAYCDGASGATYLSALRRRLVLLRELLTQDGTIFVHLDSAMVGEVKVLLDELFGRSNFRAWITRRKCSSKNYTRKTFGDITDYLLMYSKTSDYLFQRQFDSRGAEQEAVDFPKVDKQTGRRFALVPVHAPGLRNGATGSVWRGKSPPPGKHWQWTPEKLEEFDRRGDIHWTRNGTPRRKMWAEESPGSAVPNLWLDYRDPFNQNFAITGYPTEKNLELLKRVISAATKPGDLVLDCYAGSGTTLAAAGSLGRRWIGVDSGPLAVALAQKRLAEAALTPSLLSAVPGFSVLRDEKPGSKVVPIGEPDFALVERGLGNSGTPPTIQAVVPAGAIERYAPTLRPDERLVVFDHAGAEALYDASDSIQSIEKRPA
jgi:adenine-specific DNA-methyltransferase